jgi:hypothetical protein
MKKKSKSTNRPKFKRNSEETRIRDKEIRPLMEGLGWLVEVTHGNRYMKGFPDLFMGHPEHGQRWVDVKVEGRYSFTKAQKLKWPLWHSAGIGIWIMTAGTHAQVDWLWQPPNWQKYWKKSWGDPFQPPDIEDILSELDDDYYE